MSKLLKCKEQKEIFLIDALNGRKCWIENWETFVYMGFKIGDVQIIPFEELKDKYPVGDTIVKKTITTLVKGKAPRDIFYPEQSEQRKMSILWLGDQKWWKEFGGTHVVGFHEPARPDWYKDYEGEPCPLRLISYLKIDSSDNDRIRARVREAKDHPNNGGYWLISGHEPDITGNEPSVEAHKQRRIEQYKIIRAEDPDTWNHPVVIFYDMTSTFNGYPGWQKAFTGEDHDVFLIDCYAGRHDGSLDVPGMEKGAKLVELGLSRSKGQFIPCIDACYKQHGAVPPVVEQFEWWNQRFGPLEACAFWNSGIGTKVTGVYEDERIGEQCKEVNRILGLK